MSVKEVTVNNIKDKRESSANKTGYEFIGDVVNNMDIPRNRWCDHGVYRRLECSHERIFLHRNIEEGISECKQCRHEFYIKFVKELGFKFIKFSRPKKNSTLYVDVELKCGHYKSIQTGNLLANNFICKECWLADLNRSLTEAGIVVINHENGINWNCLLPYGCKSTLKINNIRKFSWSCKTHKFHSSHWESKVYLLKITTEKQSWLKLGVSAFPELRVAEYGITEDYKHEVLEQLDFKSGSLATKFEKKLHSKFKVNRLDPKFMKSAMKISGFTECYPLTMLQTLLAEFKTEIKGE